MTTPMLNELLLGGAAVAAFVVALFFLRYWRSSRDRFFLFFAASFAIECVNRIHMAMTMSWSEGTPLHYMVRLLTFGLVLVAIWDKNRPHR
jgi:hypothetical protein